MRLDIDLLRPGSNRDPYPLYDRMRREAPLYFDQRLGVWLVTGYADAVAILRDPRFHVTDPANGSVLRAEADGSGVAQLRNILHRMLLFQSPPAHTRLRTVLSRTFTPAVVEALRPRVEAHSAELLEAVAGRGAFDLMTDFAVPLPVLTIADVLGLPRDDHPRLKDWSVKLTPMLDGSMRHAGVAGAAEAMTEIVEYLERIIEARRTAPRDDLIDRLLVARDRDAEISHTELLAACVLLLLAGHETTTNLIGNGVVALLQHPDELQRLRSRPDLSKAAVEEILRFDSPVHLVSRLPAEEIEWAGQRLTEHREVTVILGAANRDPAQFPDPGRFDIGRTDNRHIAFGLGAHTCPGTGLARLESQIAIGQLLRRFPKLTLGPSAPVRGRSLVLRGFSSVPVAVET